MKQAHWPRIWAIPLLLAAASAVAYPTWQDGGTYTAGTVVYYNGHNYQALVSQTDYVGAGWNPAATPSLWKDLGAAATPAPTPVPTAVPTPKPTPTPVPTAVPTPKPTPTPVPTAVPTPRPTPTPVPTAVPTPRPTPTPVPTAVPTPRPTPTPVPTAVPTPRPTPTPVPTAVPTPRPAPTPVPTAVPGGSWLLDNNFQNDATGIYTAAAFQQDWGKPPQDSTGVAAGRLSIVADPLDSANKVLRVTYKGGQIGGSSAMTFDAPLSGTNTSLWLQYKVMFDSGFTWVKGGKLPGLGGGDTPTGCIVNGTFDGFTTRMMWRENGLAFSYLYYPGKANECGDYAATATKFLPGVWYTLSQHVTLNDPGQADGTMDQYVDGIKVLSLTNWIWRQAAAATISAIKMDTFFGGSTTDWAPTNDQYAYFDDFVVGTASPLSLVTTQKPLPAHGNPVNGYAQWVSGQAYAAGSAVYVVDSHGVYHYYTARNYAVAGTNPLTNSLLDIYLKVYSPLRLDNGQAWLENTQL